MIIVDGDALVLRHSLTHPSRPHENDLPGGIVENGELIEHGLARETREETGILINPSSVKLVHAETEVFDEADTVYFEHLYSLRLESKPDIQLSWEHDGYVWTPIHEVSGVVPAYQRGISFARKYDLL